MQLVDWSLAAATGTRLVPPGPKIALAEAVATVEDLRRTADVADEHVARITGLDVATGSARTVVVDRPDWIRANVESFQLLADPIIESLLEKRSVNAPSALAATIGSRAAGVEVGVLLSYLGTRVLGQFELLGPPKSAADDAAPGRLTLVAPNIVAAERALGVDPQDFRLWVCLHEVTHRTQFAAAPWLHGHVQDLLREFLLASDLDAMALLGRFKQAVSGLTSSAAGRSDLSLVEMIQTPEQRKILDRLTGLMSLLEGHADVVMDLAGAGVIPSVGTIRERFNQRRQDARSFQRFMRRLLGVEMKMKQYAEGAEFVRAVLADVGMAGLNLVWESPDRLPTGAEIRAPQQWLARVGAPPAA
ncbi:MAG: zinc-dependent metalloprotease [Frankiaceae bacterium]|nr:zinc-dependent metalloprotease [Frankiaceae bacterium]MBV9871297.1 zinc-dependent metalloprotease [Frankiaceae bacterium]